MTHTHTHTSCRAFGKMKCFIMKSDTHTHTSCRAAMSQPDYSCWFYSLYAPALHLYHLYRSLSLHLSPSLSLSYNKQTNKQKARGRWNTNNKTNRKHEAGETRTTKQTNIDNWNCESIYARLRHSWYGAWGYMVTQIYGDIIAATIFWLAPTAIPYSTLELHLQVIIIWGDQKCKCNEELIRK